MYPHPMSAKKKMTNRDLPRCVAPVDELPVEPGEEPLCGALATEERAVEGLVCPLCAEHAAELADDLAEDRSRDPAERSGARGARQALTNLSARLKSAPALP